ncbi:hypothetical protein B0H13DRAFT_1880150 [Mycena leptocephala]|nr:hypothetical protein B0H13DRAFT_1880150 [Mycena leptocephala]
MAMHRSKTGSRQMLQTMATNKSLGRSKIANDQGCYSRNSSLADSETRWAEVVFKLWSSLSILMGCKTVIYCPIPDTEMAQSGSTNCPGKGGLKFTKEQATVVRFKFGDTTTEISEMPSYRSNQGPMLYLSSLCSYPCGPNAVASVMASVSPMPPTALAPSGNTTNHLEAGLSRYTSFLHIFYFAAIGICVARISPLQLPSIWPDVVFTDIRKCARAAAHNPEIASDVSWNTGPHSPEIDPSLLLYAPLSMCTSNNLPLGPVAN